jgi:hypothetical protein
MKCGDDRGGNLHAHHIKRLRVIVDEIVGDVNLTSHDLFEEAVAKIIDHPDILNLDNGVTLCKECHIKAHCGTRKDVIPITRNSVCMNTRVR